MSERSEFRSRREERMEMALKIRLGARLFPKALSNAEIGNAILKSSLFTVYPRAINI
jgi:hypothetical protein